MNAELVTIRTEGTGNGTGEDKRGYEAMTGLVGIERGEVSTILATVGQAANEKASASAFTDYRSRKAQNTVRRQDGDLMTFAVYLAEVTGGDAPTGEALATDPGAWVGVSWGTTDAFCKWMLVKGYAVGTINLKLSTVKTYAKLAMKAGTLSPQETALIRSVSGYSHREGKRLDEQREQAGISVRIGNKKSDPVSLSKEQADALKDQPDSPQGRRDALLMGLLLDLGLRVSEVAGLQVDAVDLEEGTLTFYRQKVDKTQVHKLVNDSQDAMAAYLEHDAPKSGALLRGSRKGGELTDAMSTRAITARVRYLGEKVGINGLSPHDCRHYWATQAARNGTPLDRLQDAGGWSSPSMPLRYVQAAEVANEGVRL